MEDHQKIMRFSMINITEYLNKTHIDKNLTIIENNKHNMYKYRDELNTQIQMTFIENSHSLLKILEVYQYSYDMLNSISLSKLDKKKKENYSNKIYCESFKKATHYFIESMSQFITSNRYLVCEGIFDEYILLLTNDMLFIGKQIKENKHKYQLTHTLSKGIIEMTSNENLLEILTTSGIRYKIKGETEEINTFYNAFKELQSIEDDNNNNEEINEELIEYCLFTNDLNRIRSYFDKMGYSKRLALKRGKWSQENFESSEEEFHLDYNKEVSKMKNLIKTEKNNNSDDETTISDIVSKSNDSNSSDESYIYRSCSSDNNNDSEMENIKEYNKLEVNSQISNIKNKCSEIYIEKTKVKDLSSRYLAKKYDFIDAEELKLTYELFEDGDLIFNGFLLRRFNTNLKKINKIQRLKELIIDVFDYFEEYVEDLEKTVNIVGISTIKKILLIEKLIMELLKFLNKRIFNNQYEIKVSSEAIEQIKKRLNFKNYNFEYLLSNFIEERKVYEKFCLEKAKTKIKKEIKNILK